MSKYVYVLELEGGFYYVGVSSDPQARLLEHMGGHGNGAAAWPAAHRPIRFVGQPVGPLTDLQALGLEEAMTVDMMQRHGVARVRGAQWTQVVLSAEDFRAAAQRSNACLGCGIHGHVLAMCPGAALGPIATAEPPRISPAPARNTSRPQRERSRERDERSVCVRCGRDSHWAEDCYARTHADGKKLEPPAAKAPVASTNPPRTAPAPARNTSKPKRERSRERDDSDACFRCGRDSHWVDDCYARTHADGTRLSDDDDLTKRATMTTLPMIAGSASVVTTVEAANMRAHTRRYVHTTETSRRQHHAQYATKKKTQTPSANDPRSCGIIRILPVPRHRHPFSLFHISGLECFCSNDGDLVFFGGRGGRLRRESNVRILFSFPELISLT